MTLRSARHVHDMVADGRRLRGAQLVVSVAGETVCDAAIGEARPARAMTSDTVQSVFCMTKPVVAAAVCSVAEQRVVSLDASMGDESPRVAAMLDGEHLSLRAVLSHSAGLHPVLAALCESIYEDLERIA